MLINGRHIPKVEPIRIPHVINDHMMAGITEVNVSLMVTSPSSSGDVVVRPIQYDFGERCINSIHNAIDAGQGLGRLAVGGRDPVIAASIIPSSNGMNMNTSHLQEMWSFTLIIDVPRENFSISQQGGTGHRTIYTGYVLEEPVSPTRMNNPNAIFITTHMTKLSIAEGINSTGGYSKAMHITADHDVIPDITQRYYVEDLCLLSPGDIHMASYIDPDTLIGGNTGKISVSNNTAMCSIGVESTQASPAHHMQGILTSIEHSLSDVNNNLHSSIMQHNTLSPHTDFMDSLADQFKCAHIGASITPTFVNGVDHTQPLLFHKLLNSYPHMNIVRIDRHKTVQADIRSQAPNSPHNIFSSMVVSTISAVCGNLGIASVSFTYGSWITNMQNLGENGLWQIHDFGTNIQQDKFELERIINSFKMMLSKTLFNILKVQNGEFWMFIQYSSVGDILLDLQFNDFANISGLFVTSANYGGLCQAIMGNIPAFEHNSTHLNILTNAIGGYDTAPSQIVDQLPDNLFSQDVVQQHTSHHVNADYRTGRKDMNVGFNSQSVNTVSVPSTINDGPKLGGSMLRSPFSR